MRGLYLAFFYACILFGLFPQAKVARGKTKHRLGENQLHTCRPNKYRGLIASSCYAFQIFVAPKPIL